MKTKKDKTTAQNSARINRRKEKTSKKMRRKNEPRNPLSLTVNPNLEALHNLTPDERNRLVSMGVSEDLANCISIGTTNSVPEKIKQKLEKLVGKKRADQILSDVFINSSEHRQSVKPTPIRQQAKISTIGM